MLISFVIANYNHGQYIAEAIRSIAHQDHDDLEVIIVDDGSEDNSLDVIDSVLMECGPCFRRTEVLRNRTNRGKIHALNQAIPRVQGAAVVIFDADDYAHARFVPSMLSKLTQESARLPSVAFVYTDSHLVDEDNNIISRGKSAAFDKELLWTRSYIPECGLTYSAALKSVLPLDETIRVGTKHHKWKQLVRAGWEGVWLPEPLFYYRMHRSNLSGIGDRILKEVGEKNPDRERLLSGYWPNC